MDPGSYLTIGSRRYDLLQFHFHSPSEHTIDVQAWIPPKMTYYAYSGSLTTPPCSEGVRWIILQTPATISAAQVESFTDRFPRNARPVQPLNDRVVFEGVYHR